MLLIIAEQMIMLFKSAFIPHNKKLKKKISLLQAGLNQAFIGCRMVDMSSNMRLILAWRTKIVSSDKVSMKMKLWPRLWWWDQFIAEMLTLVLLVWPLIRTWRRPPEPQWFCKWIVSEKTSFFSIWWVEKLDPNLLFSLLDLVQLFRYGNPVLEEMILRLFHWWTLNFSSSQNFNQEIYLVVARVCEKNIDLIPELRTRILMTP